MQQKNANTSWLLYKRLFNYLKGYWKIFIISIIAMLIVAGTGPVFASLIKPLINEGFVDKNLEAMHWIPAAIIGLFFLRGIANFINEYSTSYLSGHLVQKLRQEMFSKMLKLPIAYFHNESSGRLMSRILNDANQITEAGFNVITVSAKDGVTVLGLLGLLLYLDWQLTLITFITLPTVGLCIRIVSKRLRRLSRMNQQYMGQMTQVLTENIDGIREIKVYGGQKKENSRFHGAAISVRRNIVKQSATNSANTAITQLLIAIALAAIIYFAAMRAYDQSFSAGDFMAFLTAMIMMFDPIKRITGIMQSLQRGLAAAESIFSFLDIAEESDNGKKIIEKVQGEICFENIYFAYESMEKNSLNGINLNISKGMKLALVGMSGSGKSTLVNLIPRFYDTSKGMIKIDGHNIQDITLENLRQHIAIVSQDVVLFNDTIANNIAYGLSANHTEADIITALESANAWSFVAKMPEGIHTFIGENGAKLSGGQRQRLAIARAILKNAPILILDEATSALDTESEKYVQVALEKLMSNKTTIIIAHRLSTVEEADRIAVMNEGEIVEVGTHTELLQRGGRYATLYSMQFNE